MKSTPVNAENLTSMLTKARKAGSVRIEGDSYEKRRAQFMKEILGKEELIRVEGKSRGHQKKDPAR
ncbi:hypothetical protein [Kalamiella sp. sgz302252]|uniref:hypothetical protein n=1 Tax=Pantoea sp. sgz302252 TaxID=3341827 RepID=UPI0036D2A294